MSAGHDPEPVPWRGVGAVFIQRLNLSVVFGELEGIDMMVAAVTSVAGRGHARDKHRDRSGFAFAVVDIERSETEWRERL
jgi:hypothetical protein